MEIRKIYRSTLNEHLDEQQISCPTLVNFKKKGMPTKWCHYCAPVWGRNILGL